MMDSEFELLKVKASIAPGSADWPSPDYSKVSIQGDVPSASAVELHWGLLHDCVSDARTRTLKALGAIAAVDEDKTLSPTGKLEKKRAIAEAAIASFEKSGALAKARAAVEQAAVKWDKELAPPAIDPTVAAEIRKHIAALKDGDRLPFATKHVSDVGPAILGGAPGFLAGLTAAEVEIVRRSYETKINPSVAEAKAKAMDALAHCEAGFRNAANTIRSSGGLDKIGNGGMAAE